MITSASNELVKTKGRTVQDMTNEQYEAEAAKFAIMTNEELNAVVDSIVQGFNNQYLLGCVTVMAESHEVGELEFIMNYSGLMDMVTVSEDDAEVAYNCVVTAFMALDELRSRD